MAEHKFSVDLGGKELTISTGTLWRSFRYNVSATGAQFTGFLTGAGEVAGTPAMGVDELFLPIVQNGRAAPAYLTNASFGPGSPCTSL